MIVLGMGFDHLLGTIFQSAEISSETKERRMLWLNNEQISNALTGRYLERLRNMHDISIFEKIDIIEWKAEMNGLKGCVIMIDSSDILGINNYISKNVDLEEFIPLINSDIDKICKKYNKSVVFFNVSLSQIWNESVRGVSKEMYLNVDIWRRICAEIKKSHQDMKSISVNPWDIRFAVQSLMEACDVPADDLYQYEPELNSPLGYARSLIVKTNGGSG